MAYTLIEPCCGSLALTLHMLGAKRSLMPYQGSKWKHRRALAALMAKHGYVGAPGTVILADTGPWLETAQVILTKGGREEVIQYLTQFALQDPKAAFDVLTLGCAEDENMALRAAEHLFLQRLAFSGKAVGIDAEGRWSSPGFNKTSAYGTPETERFGAVQPMIPALIKVLLSYADLPDVQVITALRAQEILPTFNGAWGYNRPPVVFLDPPYVGSTAYPNGTLSRGDVAHIALRWWYAGAFVMVSEGEPVAELVEQEWAVECIHAGRDDTSPFRGQQVEYVTYTKTLCVEDPRGT